MTKNKDPMLQELGMILAPCPICLQPKPCPCETAAMSIGRPCVIQSLKHMAKKAYDAGYWDSTIDAIEEAIVELERLRATVVSLQDENSHLRAINRRMVEVCIEIAPLKQFVYTLEKP